MVPGLTWLRRLVHLTVVVGRLIYKWNRVNLYSSGEHEFTTKQKCAGNSSDKNWHIIATSVLEKNCSKKNMKQLFRRLDEFCVTTRRVVFLVIMDSSSKSQTTIRRIDFFVSCMLWMIVVLLGRTTYNAGDSLQIYKLVNSHSQSGLN